MTTPSNSCHLPLEGDTDALSDNVPPHHKVIPQCLRQCSHTSLPESQLECAKARMYDSEAECSQECHLQSCCHRQDDSATVGLTSRNDVCAHREEQGMLLKNLKPQRSYSLRLGSKKLSSSKAQHNQVTSFTNGPRTCVSCQYKKATKEGVDEMGPKSNGCQSGSTVLETTAECSNSCASVPSQNSLKKLRHRLESESSTDSGCTDTRSETEEVIMTTTC